MKTRADKKAEMIDGLNRLEESLVSFASAEVKMPEKDKVKTHLMGMIESGRPERMAYGLERLAEAVRKAAGAVSTLGWAKVMMKERILDYAEARGAWSFENITAGFGVWYKRASALALLTVFALTIVVVLPEKHAVSYAKVTYLEQMNGEVFVKRNLEMIKGYPKMALKEGDIVVSEGDSSATIRFFDDSVGRICEFTRVRITKLYNDPARPVFSEVGVFLEDGRLWAKVINLVDESTFEVATDSMFAGVDAKAAFDVSVDESVTKLSVFENVVKVSAGEDAVSPSKTVIAGYRAQAESAVFAADGTEEPAGEVNITIEKLPRNEILNPTNVWVAGNLDNDQKYAETLISDRENLIETVEVDGDMESKSMYLPGAEDPAGKFEYAYRILEEAEAQLVRGEKEAGAAGLERFTLLTTEVIAALPELGAADAAAAELLKNMMKEKISIQLKDLSTFLPDNSLYKAKETVQEIELALADSDVNRAEIRLRQAGDILLEMETLLASGKEHLASTLLKRYQNKTNGITLNLTEQNVREIRERFVPLIEGQARHMKTLMAIENSIIYLNQKDLKDKVKEVREDTLRKFVVALEQMPELVPDDVLLDVTDLYATYVDDETEDTDVIEPALEKLSGDKAQGVKFINPDVSEVPSGMGIFIMVPLEGTADVKAGVALWSNSALDAANGKKSKNKTD